MQKSKYSQKNRKKGITLIITMGVLLVLSTTAITFTRLSNYERISASNYKIHVEARLTAFSGLDHGVAILFQQFIENGRINNINAAAPNDAVEIIYPHIPGEDNYDLETAMQNGQQLSLHDPDNILTEGNFSYSGLVGRRLGGGIVRGSFQDNGNLYGLKIVNSGGKFNVNSHVSSTGPEQRDSNRIVRNILRSLAINSGINPTAANNIASSIRGDNEDVPEFSSLEEISLIVETANGSSSAETQKFVDNLSVDSLIDPNTAKSAISTNLSLPPSYVPERRAPIDINSMSVELLAALIVNIQATPAFMLSSITRIDDTTIATDIANTDNSGTRGSAKESSIQHQILQETMTFTAAQAEEIAKEILFLNGVRRVFTSRADINNAIDSIESTNSASELENAVDLSATIDNPINLPPFPTAITNLLDNLGLSILKKHKLLWKQAARDALKSNFNPNVLDNFWNENIGANLLTTKNDLVAGGQKSHTTELSSFDNGIFEITSNSKILTQNNTLVLGSSSLRGTVRMFDVFQHTTQKDFVTSTPVFGDTATDRTITYPQRHDVALANSNTASATSGRVEPKPVEAASIDGSLIFATQNESGTGPSVSNILQDALFSGGTQINKVVANALGTMQRNSDILSLVPNSNGVYGNNVVNDGIISLARYYKSTATGNNAIDNNFVKYYGKVASTVDDLRTDNTSPGSNIGNTQGTLELWVKLAVDGNAPVESGILGFSTVSNLLENVTSPLDSTLIKFKEGTQTYLIKNTNGELKLTRYYYGGLFDAAGSFFGTLFNRNGDLNRKFAKRDAIIDISDWKANTWHHIIINWDDSEADLDLSMSLIVDGNQAENQVMKESAGEATATDPFFVVSGELDTVDLSTPTSNKNGMDYFMVNGIFRKQKDTGLLDSRLFQHGSGVYLGNATVDMIKSYSSQIDRGASAPSRFSPQSTYRNIFTVVNRGTLGPLRWTEYEINGGTVEAEATLNGTASHDKGQDGSGLPPNSIQTVNSGDIVQYKVTFTSPATQDGPFGSVCPILDDIQITIIRPEYLNIEEL